VFLLHDNATVHKLGQLWKNAAFWRWTIPPAVRTDFYLFRLLKKNLRGRRFHSDDDLKAAIDDFFESQAERPKGLGSLEEEWSKCTGVGVNYIKKFNDQKNRTSFVS
jgi:hypothetical protein